MRSLTVIPLLLAAGFLSACVETSPATPDAPMVGMANPASVYCGEQGGESVIRDTPEGQVGECHLPDGSVVDEWAYYRANHPG